MLKILVVDDSKLARRRIIQMITEVNVKYEVVAEAVDGEEALKQFTQFKPNLVITDLEMPKLSGIELIYKLKEIEDIPILVISSLINQEIKHKLHTFKNIEFLRKPINSNFMNRVLLKLEYKLTLGES